MFLTYTVDGSLTGSTFLDDNLATGMKIIMHISLFIILELIPREKNDQV